MSEAMEHAANENTQVNSDEASDFVSLTRRGFVSTAALSLIGGSLLAACGGGGDSVAGPTGGTTAVAAVGATLTGNVITLTVVANPSLATTGGLVLVGRVGQAAVDTLVLNLGDNNFQAYTSICTHEACDVNRFAQGVLVCPCHGSQYDTSGKVVQGPARGALRKYATSFDAATGTVSVTKA